MSRCLDAFSPLTLHFPLMAAALANLLPVVLMAGIAVVVIGSVAPRLRREPPQSAALRSWTDIWFPLLLVLPLGMFAATMETPRAVAGLRSDWPALWAVVVLPAAACILAWGVATAMSHNVGRFAAPGRLHGIMLLFLAVVILAAAAADRLSPWHGQILLTIAIIWLWAVSAEPLGEGRANGRAAGIVSANSTASRWFLVDWAAPLRTPLSWSIRGGLLAMLAAIGVSVALWRGFSPPIVGGAAALMQVSVLIMLAVRVDARSAQRAAISTLLLIVLVGLGVTALRLAPWDLFVTLLNRMAASSAAPTQLIGLSALRPVGFISLALGLYLLLDPQPDEPSPPAGIVAVAGAALLVVSGFVGAFT